MLVQINGHNYIRVAKVSKDYKPIKGHNLEIRPRMKGGKIVLEVRSPKNKPFSPGRGKNYDVVAEFSVDGSGKLTKKSAHYKGGNGKAADKKAAERADAAIVKAIQKDAAAMVKKLQDDLSDG